MSIGPGIDAVAREALARWEEPLARVGLRGAYQGIAEREGPMGARESSAAIWFFRGDELMDVLELPVEVPGLDDVTPERARVLIEDALAELLALHRDVGPVPVRAPVEGAGYAARLVMLVRRVMPVVAGAGAVGYLGLSVTRGTGPIALVLAVLAFIGTYIAAMPTALLASLLHTAVMRRLPHESVGMSVAAGAVIGTVFGAGTPWLIPIVEPWPLLPIGAAALAGSVVGGAYGALATRHVPLPPRLAPVPPDPPLPAGDVAAPLSPDDSEPPPEGEGEPR